MTTVHVDAADMRALAKRAKAVGTEHAWMDVALEWMEAAEKEIARLRKAEATAAAGEVTKLLRE